MERYIVFIRNNTTGEEFATTSLQIADGHELAVISVRQNYPAPRYTVHTAYTERDLQKILRAVSGGINLGRSTVNHITSRTGLQ